MTYDCQQNIQVSILETFRLFIKLISSKIMATKYLLLEKLDAGIFFFCLIFIRQQRFV